MKCCIAFRDEGRYTSVIVHCASEREAQRIASYLPAGQLVPLDMPRWPTDPKKAAVLTMLAVRRELNRIAEESKCS